MNLSDHDILLAFFWVFIGFPSLGALAAGIAQFFDIITTPPKPKFVPPPPFYEEKYELHWCINCRKTTKQKLWSYRPNAPFQRECLNCHDDPYRDMVW